MGIDDFEIGEELDETEKYLQDIKNHWRKAGFTKDKKYVFMDTTTYTILDKTSSSILVHHTKRLNTGVDCINWYTMKGFLFRFKKK